MGVTTVRFALLGLVVAAVINSSQAHASPYDDTDKLKGQYIAEVGDLRRIECPIGGKYDCLQFPDDLYQMSYSRCFRVHGYRSFSAKALIAVDEAKTISAFVVEAGYGSAIRQYRVTPYKCPDLF